ncbi:MAG TPA: hypothetical protein VE999_06340 [Gemmataceae bacterium]|nr:hypothetical protein [Gemmataceae bacterium]
MCGVVVYGSLIDNEEFVVAAEAWHKRMEAINQHLLATIGDNNDGCRLVHEAVIR